MNKIMINKTLLALVTILLLTTVIFPVFTAYSDGIDETNVGKAGHQNDIDKSKKASININRYDPDLKRIVKEHIKNITKEEAEQLKEEILEIQDKCCSNIEKIQQQLDIFHKWNILPSNLSIEDFLLVMDRMKNNSKIFSSPSIVLPTPGVILFGPSIISYFTIGGISYPIHLFLPRIIPSNVTLWLNITIDELLYGTQLRGWVGFEPAFVPISPTMSFINVFGPFIYGPTSLLSPFIAVEIVSIGFSIDVTILESIVPVVLFDWVVDACLMGGIVYLAQSIPDN